MSSLSLVSGVLPAALLILGGLSLLWLAAGRTRHLLVVVPAAAAAAGALTLLLWYLAESVFHWWDASLPRLLYIYAGLGIFAVILAVLRIKGSEGISGRVLPLTAAALALLAVSVTVNASYAQYPTVASLFDPAGPVSGSQIGRASCRERVF